MLTSCLAILQSAYGLRTFSVSLNVINSLTLSLILINTDLLSCLKIYFLFVALAPSVVVTVLIAHFVLQEYDPLNGITSLPPFSDKEISCTQGSL